ncbi:hypothetical protein BH10CYA1_BH10CYA1_17390 [soil metagenome]
MTENDSSNNPAKRVAKGGKLPFPVNPLVATAPAVVIFLILGWIYFSGTIQLMLGLRELKEENHEEKAIPYLNWAISSNPSMAEAYAQRASARLTREQQKGMKADYSGPIGDIARAIKLEPKNNEYYATSMKIEEAAHHFRVAIAGYSHLIDLNDGNHESYLNKRAGLYYIVGDYVNSRADREQIIKIDKLPLEERARQYVFLGETDKALSDYEECVKKEPNGDDLLHIGYLYENSGRSSQAIQAYSQLIKLVNSDDAYLVAQARFRRANLYLKAGENENALADADHLVKYTKTVLDHAFHIKILDIMHRTAAAQAERKAVLDQLNFAIDDVFKEASNEVLAGKYIERARFYAADQHWKKALRDYSVALRLNPDSRSYIACAQMYTKLGDYDKAVEFFTKALSPNALDNLREEAYSGLAEVHLLAKKPQLAVEDCNKAIAQGTETGAGSYWRGKAYRQLGKNDLAKTDEQQALGLGFLPVY